jgi:hypothetical protein
MSKRRTGRRSCHLRSGSRAASPLLESPFNAYHQYVTVLARTSADRSEEDDRVSKLDRFPDLLVVGLEDWDEVERRHQLLLREVSLRHPRCQILFVESPARLTLPGRLHDLAVRRVSETLARVRIVRPLPEWTEASRGMNDPYV